MKDFIKIDIARHRRHVYKVTLTQAQLDDIHDFYHVSRKQSLKDLIYYRMINHILSMIIFVVVLLLNETNLIVLGFFFVFSMYNFIHGVIQYIQYKRIKEPTRLSDEG
jgi:hypothetical protein